MRSQRIALLLLILLVATTGCSLIAPLPAPQTIAERLNSFPRVHRELKAPVEIHWTNEAVPFVIASSDSDAYFALGLIHAHLRLGQMELLRRVSSGRLSEMFGPVAVDIDYSLRILGLDDAVPGITAALPPETRLALDRFVAGINSYASDPARLPHDFIVLGLEVEPWTVEDVVRMSRLAGAEINWLYWFGTLGLRREPAWAEFWERSRQLHRASTPSFGAADFDLGVLAAVSKSGSNSFVLRARGQEGSVIANDPHVGFFLPNLWLIAGVRTPAVQTIGLMFPGIPFTLLGRNEHLAWGGTNMLALTSSLYRVDSSLAGLAREEPGTIRVRWWPDKPYIRRVISPEPDIRMPILSDIPYFSDLGTGPFALRWVGHGVTDELSAFYRANRATSWPEFRSAFSTYGVSGQNILYAHKNGEIGQLLAVQLPRFEADFSEGILLNYSQAKWRGLVGSEELPAAYNPKRSFLVSANNMPLRFDDYAPSDLRIALTYSSNDRVRRLTDLLAPLSGQKQGPAIRDLMKVQMDTLSPSAAELQKEFSDLIGQLTHESAAPAHAESVFLQELRSWNGDFSSSSRGALAFNLTYYYLASRYYESRYGPKIRDAILGTDQLFLWLLEDIRDPAERPAIQNLLPEALRRASTRFRVFQNWGGIHRLELTHPLGRAPLIGFRYRFGEFPIGGSSTTVMKTFAGLSADREYCFYGANARHISKLDDLDENYFVLLGGQDGFFNSQNFLDQVELWRFGRYLKLPLSEAGIRAGRFHRTDLFPPDATEALGQSLGNISRHPSPEP